MFQALGYLSAITRVRELKNEQINTGYNYILKYIHTLKKTR